MDITISDVRLYLESETSFDHNKYILSECISGFVTESADGILDLELEYPIKDKKNLSKLLVRKNIIKCSISTTDKRGKQLFKIRTTTPNTANTVIKVYAQAIGRRDLDSFNMVVDLKTTPGITRKQVIQEILNHCAKPHRFNVGNLDNNSNTNINMGTEEETGNTINYLTINGISPRSAFLSETENSIYKAWGGEIIWNNFEINMVNERGDDNSFEIRSGKNLQELEQTIDDTDLDNFITAIMPVSSDGVYLPNHEIIYSPNHAALEGGFFKLVCDDVSLVDNTPEAFNVLYGQLRDRVQKKFDEGVDKIKINNTVKFVQLANTEEYKEFKHLEKCEIGNNVTIKYYDLFDSQKKTYIEAIGRVLKIKFNILTNRIDEVEIGDRKKKNILSTISSTVNKTTDLNDKTNTNKINIKKTAKELTDSINTHVVELNKRDDSIEMSVTDLSKNTTAKFSIEDEKIASCVLNSIFQSYITETADTIATMVKKGEFGSYITQNYDKIVEAIEDATGSHTCTFDSSGLTVQNGGIYIKDDSGTTQLWMNSDGHISVKDLYLDPNATGSNSEFIGSLANIRHITFQEVSVNRLTLNQDEFYITIDGDSGYTLNQAIDKRLEGHGLI